MQAPRCRSCTRRRSALAAPPCAQCASRSAPSRTCPSPAHRRRLTRDPHSRGRRGSGSCKKWAGKTSQRVDKNDKIGDLTSARLFFDRAPASDSRTTSPTSERPQQLTLSGDGRRGVDSHALAPALGVTIDGWIIVHDTGGQDHLPAAPLPTL